MKLAETSFVLRAYRFARKVVEGLFEHHAFDHAATMAFYFFLGSIPLLVFAGMLVGTVVQREGAEELAAPLYRAMPAAASELIRHQLEGELGRLAGTNTRSVAPLSLVGFLWLTTNGIHNLMDVFELLIGAKPRSWFRQRSIALVWVIAGLAAVGVITWLLLFINGVASDHVSAQKLPILFRRVREFVAEGWQRFGVLAVLLGMLSGSLALFYRTAVRHPPGIRRRVWIGTLVALVLWGIVSWAFGRYVQTIADYAVYYGGLATVAVILLWLYLTSLALLVGAEVNSILEGMRAPP